MRTHTHTHTELDFPLFLPDMKGGIINTGVLNVTCVEKKSLLFLFEFLLEERGWERGSFRNWRPASPRTLGSSPGARGAWKAAASQRELSLISSWRDPP